MNKRKVLDTARKYAQKGAKEKALKEYAKLLKADSRDAKLLLEIGDAHRRWGQNEEAISHYNKVAEQYKQGGFDARAVAVFKQIINLDGKRYPAYVSLAELYQRMGLDAEAINALQTAADGYHKEGRKVEALELLRKMAGLDPSNTVSRMKVADLLRQESMLDDAVAEYEAVAQELVRQGANDELVPVYERILEIRPERPDIEFALARNLVQLSQAERAEPYARRAFDEKPDGEGHFELLNGIYSELGRMEALAEVTKQMAQLHRSRGNEDLARELMQRLPQDNGFALSGDSDADLGAAEDSQPSIDEGFLDDDFLADDSVGRSDDDSFIDIGGDDDLELDLGSEDELEAPVEESVDATSGVEVPEGDPDQLFAEASVYLRYGKRDQAIASLEAILAQEPRHRDALEKIGECYADAGDAPRAVGFWTEAAGLARNAGDDAALDVLRERIAVLDPDAAAAIEPIAKADAGEPIVANEDEAGASSGAAVDDGEDDIELDLDFEEEDGAEAAADDDDDEVEELSLDESVHDMSRDDIDVAVEDDVSVEIDIEGLEAMDDEAAGEEPDHEIEIDAEVEISGLEQGDVTADDSAPSSQGANGDSQKIAEDLEEAEFYMEQQLFDEAEVIFERILEASPNHPSAQVRLGELRAARGEDPASEDAARASSADVTLDPSELPFEESEVEIEEDDEDELSASDDGGEAELGEDSELEIAVEFDSDDAQDESEAVDPDEVSAADVSAGEASAAGDVDETVNPDNTMPLYAEEGEEPAGEQTEEDFAAVEQADDDDSFDLAAELRESLAAEDERAEHSDTSASGETTSEDEGFASIFKDFKSGVEKTLGENDFETRFDLGIAYRGMELYDDALGEFRICLDSPGHRLESLHMMGLCAMDLGRFADASNHLEQALASPDLPEPKEAGLRFDLGRAFEGLGDHARAKEAFEVAKAADPTIPGIDACIDRASARLAGGDDGIELQAEPAQGAGFEDFDDLVAEVEAEEESTGDEAFESFDDVVAEVEADEVAGVPIDDAEDTAPTVEDDDGDPDRTEPDAQSKGSAPRKRKKKRISFV